MASKNAFQAPSVHVYGACDGTVLWPKFYAGNDEQLMSVDGGPLIPPLKISSFLCWAVQIRSISTECWQRILANPNTLATGRTGSYSQLLFPAISIPIESNLRIQSHTFVDWLAGDHQTRGCRFFPGLQHGSSAQTQTHPPRQEKIHFHKHSSGPHDGVALPKRSVWRKLPTYRHRNGCGCVQSEDSPQWRNVTHPEQSVWCWRICRQGFLTLKILYEKNLILFLLIDSNENNFLWKFQHL